MRSRPKPLDDGGDGVDPGARFDGEGGGDGQVEEVRGIVGAGAEPVRSDHEYAGVDADPVARDRGAAHRLKAASGPCREAGGGEVVDVEDEQVVTFHVAVDVGFGGGVPLEGAVPVEVVGSQVGDAGGEGMEGVHEAKLETGGFDHHHVPLAIDDTRQRRPDVARGDGAPA